MTGQKTDFDFSAALPDGSTDSTAHTPPPMRLSGLEPVAIGSGSLFVNIGERTNVTGRRDGPLSEADCR